MSGNPWAWAHPKTNFKEVLQSTEDGPLSDVGYEIMYDLLSTESHNQPFSVLADSPFLKGPGEDRETITKPTEFGPVIPGTIFFLFEIALVLERQFELGFQEDLSKFHEKAIAELDFTR